MLRQFFEREVDRRSRQPSVLMAPGIDVERVESAAELRIPGEFRGFAEDQQAQAVRQPLGPDAGQQFGVVRFGQDQVVRGHLDYLQGLGSGGSGFLHDPGHFALGIRFDRDDPSRGRFQFHDGVIEVFDDASGARCAGTSSHRIADLEER